MNLITYADKVRLNENPNVAEINKVTADNMNEIKNAINNLIYPIGTYYETSDLNFNPNIVWGGTWELENDGTVLVSKSSVSGSKFNVNLGTVVGEETHTLTTGEMPRHNHGFTSGAGNVIANQLSPSSPVYFNLNNNGLGTTQIDYAGGSQSHNNVQPSKVVNRWHRTA